MALKFKEILLIFAVLLIHLACQFKSIVAEPGPPLESHFTFLIRSILIGHDHRFANVNVHLPYHQIMDTDHWKLHLYGLVEFLQMEVDPELLRYPKHFAIESYISLLVCKHGVSLSFAIDGSHGRMVRNLLRQKVKSISAHLKCLKQHRVERFPNRFFGY